MGRLSADQQLGNRLLLLVADGLVILAEVGGVAGGGDRVVEGTDVIDEL